jgi:hypothetical protein
MLTDLVVANPEEAAAVSSNSNRAAIWPCFSANGLDNSVLAALWSALDPAVDSSPLEGEAHLIFSEDKAGPWVFHLPGSFVTKLSSVTPESVVTAAERWVKHPELAHAGWSASDVAPAIEALSQIASTAEKMQKALLLWMSL